MIINDCVYGKVRINEPILVELINSSAIQRLKNISQFGIPDKYYWPKGFSRYEHSVGVMILTRRFGATLEEQIAALLHDVSVTAFSHIGDWVFGDGKKGKEDYHDKLHTSYIRSTNIPTIFNRYNFSYRRISDLDNYSLTENKLPDLCADRVDYALREYQHWLSPKSVRVSLECLRNINGKIVFLSVRSAYIFSKNFILLQNNHWGAETPVRRYYIFSRTVKRAIKKGIIKKKDFHDKDEMYMISRLEKTKDSMIKADLGLLRKRKVGKLNDGEVVYKKFRYVDPEILENGKLVRLSSTSNRYSNLLKKAKRQNKKGIRI